MSYEEPKTWALRDPLNVSNLNTWIRDQQRGLKELIDSKAAVGPGVMADVQLFDSYLAVGTGIMYPADWTLLYIMFRQSADAAWLGGIMIDKAIMDGFTEVAVRDLMASGNAFSYYFSSPSHVRIWRIGKVVGGELGVAVQESVADRSFDRVCVRFI